MSSGNFDPTEWMRALDPMMRTPSPNEVRNEAKERSAKIYNDYEKLQKYMALHEALIIKRWAKKTKKQKTSTLLAAWGEDMSQNHRPDIIALKRESKQQRQAGTRFRAAFMWPQVNLEDLCKPKSLPLLLHSRANYPPSEFAGTDWEFVSFGRICFAVQPAYLNDHVMLLNAQAREDYGRLLHWDDHPDAFIWMQDLIQFIPGEGLIVLEIQDRLMEFLVKCVKCVLHDFSEYDLSRESEQSRATSMPDPDPVSALSALSTITEEAPYRRPSQIDFVRIVQLLEARVEAAKDHMLSLREDPPKFYEYTWELYDHRLEHVLDDRGRKHSLFRTNQPHILWARVLSDLTTSAMENVELWNELHKQAINLQRLHSLEQPKPGDSLSDELWDALLKFQHFVEKACEGPFDVLGTAIPASHPWRSRCRREPEHSPSDPEITLAEMNFTGIHKELWHLLDMLKPDGYQLFLWKLYNIIDETQRIINSNEEARSCITGLVAAYISDLAILGECLRQLISFQPWAREYEQRLVDKKDGIEAQWREWNSAPSQSISLFSAETAKSATPGSAGRLLADFGAPVEGRFDYPITKRQTGATVNQMRLAEQNLDNFWSQVDLLLKKSESSLKQTTSWKLLQQPRVVQRTPPWQEQAKKAPCQAETLGVENLSIQSFEHTDIHQEATSGRTLVQSAEHKQKEKTRGEAQPSEDIAEEQLSSAQTPQRIHVDNRALKVFKTLFFTPGLGTTPGELPWLDFLHGMASAGFSGEQLYGSVWHFTPTNNPDLTRSIQFHSPHPAAKIPYLTARRHGRRLNRAFGWTIKSFVLKTANEQQNGDLEP